MKTVLITGANRGIGLALAARFASKSWNVIATARDPASRELDALVRANENAIRAIALDVVDPAAIAKLAAETRDVPIDVLVNNAGVPGRTAFGDVTADEIRDVFAVNTFAPLLVTQALRANLAHGGKVVNVSSVLGSIESSRGAAGYLTYAMSKAALNMFTVQLAATLAKREIAVLALHPGWVQTRMGGSGAAIDVDTSADGMMRVIEDLDMETSGSYLAYDGSVIPW